MDLHLFTTDISALDLIKLLPKGDRVVCLVIPENRAGSEKVKRLVKAAVSDYLIYVHRKGRPVFKNSSVEGGISWLYSQIIPNFDSYSAGILNMHGGQISKYRGANALQWAIINGEKELGITWHGLVEEVDAGPIWGESRIPISPDCTAMELREAMIREGLKLFPQTWQLFRYGTYHHHSDLGPIWPRRLPHDGRINPGWSERRVRDMVRALCPPWPPATIKLANGWVAVDSVLKASEVGAIPYQTLDNGIIYLRLKTPENG